MNSDIFEEADNIVHGERAKAYGPPERNFRRIAQAWSAILGYDVGPVEVALCMAALKLVRESTGVARIRDNYVDAAGYIQIAWELVDGE